MAHFSQLMGTEMYFRRSFFGVSHALTTKNWMILWSYLASYRWYPLIVSASQCGFVETMFGPQIVFRAEWIALSIDFNQISSRGPLQKV